MNTTRTVYAKAADPSQKDWNDWRENNVKNPNYHLMHDLVFHYFMGLFCFRAGVRRNNSDFMIAGRQQAAPIMFIGRHRIYRKLLYRDMQTRVEAPDDVKTYIDLNESFSKVWRSYKRARWGLCHRGRKTGASKAASPLAYQRYKIGNGLVAAMCN